MLLMFLIELWPIQLAGTTSVRSLTTPSMSSMDLSPKRLLVRVLLCAVAFRPVLGAVNPAMVEKVNSLHSSWKAEVHHDLHIRKNFSKTVRPPDPGCRTMVPDTQRQLPRFFNAINRWHRTCKELMNRVRSEGQCDSSWAVAVVSMLSDRICIETHGKLQVHLSAHDVMTCCESCRMNRDDPCEGGCALEAIKFWRRRGIVTGGECNSNEGCKPYNMDTGTSRSARCEHRCTNKGYHRKSFEDDKSYGGLVYKLPNDARGLRHEIFDHGPVVASMVIYEDLEIYSRGVYMHLIGQKVGYQYIKIIGWGTQDGIQYWLCVNSLGREFGENGQLKILRGVNHNQIEEGIVAGRLYNRLVRREELISRDEGANLQASLLVYAVAEIVLLDFLLR